MAKYSEWSAELEAALAEPFPADWVKQKKAGRGERSTSISFVPWHRYVSKLNSLCGGGWSMGTPLVLHVGDKLVLAIPVTIFGVTRVNFGDEDDSEWETQVDEKTGEETEKKTMYGSPCTNAFAQSFKRTCALFGIGLDMYNKGGAKAQPATQADPLDAVAPGKKAGGKTWKQLLADEEGKGFVTWALKSFTTMAPALRTALTEALAPKADATQSILLENELHVALNLDAVTPDQEKRVRDAIEGGDVDQVRIAADWVANQIQRKKLGAGV